MLQRPQMIGLLSAFVVLSCSAYSSTLKMEAICSSNASVDFQRSTWCYIPEDNTFSDTDDILEVSEQYLLNKC
jgi:hypothetical protein